MKAWTNVLLVLSIVFLFVDNAKHVVAKEPVGKSVSLPGEVTAPISNVISDDPDFFPIGVWYQDPIETASEFKEIGVNTFIGQYYGNSNHSLQTIEKLGMKVIAPQDEAALGSNSPVIIAWHNPDDEPDIGRLDDNGKRIKPAHPIPPKEVVADYQTLKERNDRPVYVNFGPGVAFNDYHKGGNRYRPYIAGADIVSFDIYPLNPEVYGMKEPLPFSMIADGTKNLRRWAINKPVYVFIETISLHGNRPAPNYGQMRAQVWLALINGAQGIEYFCHRMQPTIIEDQCLRNPQTKSSLKRINREINDYAPLLNAETIYNPIGIKSTTRIDTLEKKWNEQRYILAQEVLARDGKVTFKLPLVWQGRVEVMDENRTIPIRRGKFNDYFTSHQVHKYKIVVTVSAWQRKKNIRQQRRSRKLNYQQQKFYHALGKARKMFIR